MSTESDTSTEVVQQVAFYERLDDLLLQEHAHFGDSLLRNEEDGEKRVTFFITLAGAVGAVIAFVLKDGQALMGTISPAQLVRTSLAALLLFGATTFMRIIKRNISSDKLKVALREIRLQFVSDHTRRQLPHAFFTLDEIKPRKPFTGFGGWLDTVTLANAGIAGLLGYSFGRNLLFAGVAALAAFALQILIAAIIYSKAAEKLGITKPPT